MKIPVIFLSKTIRISPEIELVVKQACKNNEDVFLLGDDGNKSYCPDNHVSIFDYYEGATEFEKLYRHLSTNDLTVELFCFSRWFIMRDFLRKNNMKINPDFSELEKLVKKMGAEKQYAKIKKELADEKKAKLKIKKIQKQLEAKNLSEKKAGRLGTKLQRLMINLKGRPRGK